MGIFPNLYMRENKKKRYTCFILEKWHNRLTFLHFKPKTSIEPIENSYNHEQVHHLSVNVHLSLLDCL